MKKLPEKFQFRGFEYLQEWRDNKYAIYGQYLAGEFISHEAIIIKKNKPSFRFGKEFEASESYPLDKEWGSRGWTFKTFSEAEQKIAMLRQDDQN